MMTKKSSFSKNWLKTFRRIRNWTQILEWLELPFLILVSKNQRFLLPKLKLQPSLLKYVLTYSAKSQKKKSTTTSWSQKRTKRTSWVTMNTMWWMNRIWVRTNKMMMTKKSSMKKKRLRDTYICLES